MNKCIIIIPLYNEEKHIKQLLIDIKKHCNLDILIIDDGSIDKSIEIANKYADYVLIHKENMGKGRSLIDGMCYAKDKYEYAILMDADGQHLPQDIKKFLNMEYEKYKIIIGKRDMNIKNMPILRYFVNRITTLVTSILANKRTYDSQSGFRMVSINDILNLNIKTLRFQMESEMLIRAGKKGMPIGFVNIKTIYGDEVSKINPILDTLRFIKMTLEVLWL